jgi:hypothetical protein
VLALLDVKPLAMRLDVALLVAAETAHRCFSHAANYRFYAA